MIAAFLAAYVVHGIACLFTLWIMFVVVMTMEQLRDAGRLTPGMIRFGEGFAAAGLVLDVYCNLVIATTMVFWEEPHEMTVSDRLRRLVISSRWKWQRKLAIWFAATLMNPFCQPDRPHIKIPKL
ncbi:MAG TPA: hypothetical protein VN081_06960 [Dongiaceae bacterium]|nr:hypothetical protein [Dongiaceae bacterium]